MTFSILSPASIIYELTIAYPLYDFESIGNAWIKAGDYFMQEANRTMLLLSEY